MTRIGKAQVGTDRRAVRSKKRTNAFLTSETTMNRNTLLTFILILLVASVAAAQPRKDSIAPTYKRVHYGPDKRQVINFWKAESKKPTPLLIYIHGGVLSVKFHHKRRPAGVFGVPQGQAAGEKSNARNTPRTLWHDG